MMNKLFITTLAFFLLDRVSGQSLIGYVKGAPVILNQQSAKAFKVSEKMELAPFNSDAGKILLAINDCGMVYGNYERMRLVCKTGNRSLEINLSTGANSIEISGDCKFLVVHDL